MRILLGAIVTNMAGSVGGQTVRRSQNGLILYNKPQKKNIGAVTSNPQVRLMQELMTTWNEVDPLERAAVITRAATLQFTNTFGEKVYLKPFQYYVSAMSKLAAVGRNDLSFLDSPVSIQSVPILDINVIAGSGTIPLEMGPIKANTNFILKIFISQKGTIFPTEKMAVIFYGGVFSDYSEMAAFAKVQSIYPNLQVVDTYTIFAQSVSLGGYAGGWVEVKRGYISSS